MKFTVNENPQRFLNEEVEKVYHMHDGSFSVAVDRMEEKESLLLFSRFRLASGWRLRENKKRRWLLWQKNSG